MDDPILALALLSLGAFVGVMVTGLFYVSVVRPNWMGEPPQDFTVNIPRQSSVKADAQAGGGEALASLRSELNSLRLLLEQQQDPTPNQQVLNLIQQINDRIENEQRQLNVLTNDQRSALTAVVNQLDTQTGILSHANAILENMGQLSQVSNQINALSEKLNAQESTLGKLVEDLQTMNLSAALLAQSESLGRLDARIERHHDLLEEMDDQIDRVEVDVRPVKKPDRLTDIKGIGPKYAGVLYEAGIETFQQLAAFSPDELRALINPPKRVNVEAWIEHAKQLAAKSEKLEKNR